MGLATVAVYSECDRNALHVRLADEAHAIGPDQASESYLRIDKLIDVARSSGAGAVHPGYGFLAENAEFAESCVEAGLTFIGPDAAAMRMMGSKTSARDIAIAAGVPVVPGGNAPEGIGFPLLVKAVAGGGGKGMRVVRAADELESAVRLARSEALSSFGDDRVYFERLLDRPRHVEVQVLGDTHGDIVHVCRARVLDSAKASEAHRGNPLAGGHAGASRAADGGRRDNRARGEVHECGNN